MKILETERLILQRLTLADAAFILELLNEPSFLRFIGDRGVRDLEGARRYLAEGPLVSYERHGFGLYATVLKESGDRIGMCGLVKRDGLDDVDIGFAFLPRFWSHGYASEAAAAVLGHARDVLGLRRVVAITAVDNHGSIRVLEKLGLRCERLIRLPGESVDTKLFTPADETSPPA